MKLNLGVMDVPYSHSAEGETTFEVAEILENKYSVMQIFLDMHMQDIATDLENGIAGAIDNAFMGNPSKDLFAGAMSRTEERFRQYIDTEEHGIRLKKQDAPKAGGRKKRQYKKVERVTPFIYSGLYRISFRSWITE